MRILSEECSGKNWWELLTEGDGGRIWKQLIIIDLITSQVG
jgi:hypothetical protein